ncbi:MAG: universal stress protein [Actinobacteria bacterium]|nr:universal stress protein [Actinomycetota bacterium]
MSGTPRVIVGVSGSPTSLNALRRAVAEARMRGVPLEVAHVYPLALWALGYPEGRGSLEQAARDRLAGFLQDGLGEVPADLHTTQVVTGSESPAAALATRAVRPDDLLVLGTGHPRWLLRWRTSPVVRYCLRTAICPVLVVPPHPLARELGHWRMRRHSLDRELAGLLHE